MTNENAIEIIEKIKKRLLPSMKEEKEAFDMAIESLYSFEHGCIKHPVYGECDCWIDRKRMLLFFYNIPCEYAISHGWTWNVEEGDNHGTN